MKFKCQTCGKVIAPKNKKLSCCGITESLDKCVAENKRHRRALNQGLTRIVDLVLETPDNIDDLSDVNLNDINNLEENYGEY